MQPKSKRPNIVVIGGGFAGLQLLKHLDDDLFNVLLIDKLNHHQFQPLFYQVATSQIEPGSISFPLRKILQNRKNTQIRMTEVTSIDPVGKNIYSTIGCFHYDILILANGCSTNYFGNEEIKKNTYSLKSTYDAIKIRNNILQNFENILSTRPDEREYLYNLVIIGAGPTGVELAGAFAEIRNHILPKDYPRINFKDLRIILIEGSANTLNSMSDLAKKASERYLKNMGVDILTNVMVKNYDGKEITLNNGHTIKSKQVIWTAGVIGNVIEGLNKDSIFRNRYIVNRYSQIKNYPDIYAVGDIAYMETPKYPQGHPQVANVAINQARNLAKNLKYAIEGKSLNEYEYYDKGTMATIGKKKAVVDLPFLHFKGFIAWLIWMFLHLMLILSVRNKMIIFINWAWLFFTRDTSLRLILKEQQ
ncbi:MAG TPA: NAD(P)/FAD-dependent oxidoreductase [Lentimicrobium sp.]|nr:NAD(P)/FAD-dependent oxidoreductase [Lentimicrobium sp.]